MLVTASPARHTAHRPWFGVVLLSTLGLLVVVVSGLTAGRSQTPAIDLAVRHWVLSHQFAGAAIFFTWVSTIGSVAPMAGYAAIGALLLIRRGRWGAGLAVVASPAAAVCAYVSVKWFVGRPRPSVAGLLEGTSSFPSAHATSAAAVCVTLAFVWWREGLLSSGVAVLAATLVPLLVGASRIYNDVHWASDVLGGWGTGLLVGAASASVYQLVSPRTQS